MLLCCILLCSCIAIVALLCCCRCGSGREPLTRLVESAMHESLGGQVQVGIFVYNTSCVASQFEDDLLFTRLGFEFPSDFGAARKREQIESLIDCKSIRTVSRARQNGKCSCGVVDVCARVSERVNTCRV